MFFRLAMISRLNIPIPTPAPIRGGPGTCLGGPVATDLHGLSTDLHGSSTDLHGLSTDPHGLSTDHFNHRKHRKITGKMLEHLLPFLGHSY